ncbi:MAG TPA: hypothetical protein VKB46_01935 [Pyrinomonadaceae bacterium]|nr:hypothetical protein [Pyrinomonadaceae bacterium]
MRQCLDEGRLQSYFDGELSSEMMENTTLHLASCATCAAAARELEEESLLLSKALAPEFESSVPTAQLRQRIDAAVLGMRPSHTHVESVGVLANFRKSLSGLFSFTPQRTLGYASLMIVLAFAAIFGIIKLRQPTVTQPPFVAEKQPAVQTPNTAPPDVTPTTAATGGTEIQQGPGKAVAVVEKHPQRQRKNLNANSAPQLAERANHPKLLPGEKSYLQTIAKLDLTIKAGNTAMRPALQVEYQRNLAVVDRAIAATRSAAKSNPNDPDAAEFMFAAYQSKVDLLNTIADARVRTH